ncbi:hypothetical protein TruAng_006974 [Truncatella angustata]|nr:hypothetical protein TruAng_006974 [Truncatella angustata]
MKPPSASTTDALARYRTSMGLKTVSLDLGWIENIGIVAETASYQRNRRIAADIMAIEDTELLVSLNIYGDPGLPVLHQAKRLGTNFAGGVTNPAALFRHATGSEERTEVVVQWLAAKLARAMSSSVDDVEPFK